VYGYVNCEEMAKHPHVFFAQKRTKYVEVGCDTVKSLSVGGKISHGHIKTQHL
jgi:hypothetical protein